MNNNQDGCFFWPLHITMGFKEERTLINLRRMPGTKQSIVKHMPENSHEPAFLLSMHILKSSTFATQEWDAVCHSTSIAWNSLDCHKDYLKRI